MLEQLIDRSTPPPDAPSASSTAWLPCTIIRPLLGDDNGPGKFEVSNGLARKRIAVSKKALMDFVASGTYGESPAAGLVRQRLESLGLMNAPADPATLDGIRHWKERNWTYALGYYLWSARHTFVDTGDDAEEVQERVLDEYAALPDSMPQFRRASGERIELAAPAELPDEAVGQVLRRRTSSFRLPKRPPVPQQELSAVLWHGLSAVRFMRQHDSAGTALGRILYSFGSALDFYVAVYTVDGLQPGVYFYDPLDHVLELVRDGDFRTQMQGSLWGQRAPLTAGCTFLITAEFQRYQWRYRHERALRILYIDAARIAQFLILLATAFRRAVHLSPAIDDLAVLSILQRDPAAAQVLHTVSMG